MRALVLLLLLAGCGPAPVGPDSSPEEIALACDAGDLDACMMAARTRNQGYEAAMLVK
jgi:hypothetical protein